MDDKFKLKKGKLIALCQSALRRYKIEYLLVDHLQALLQALVKSDLRENEFSALANEYDRLIRPVVEKLDQVDTKRIELENAFNADMAKLGRELREVFDLINKGVFDAQR